MFFVCACARTSITVFVWFDCAQVCVGMHALQSQSVPFRLGSLLRRSSSHICWIFPKLFKPHNAPPWKGLVALWSLELSHSLSSCHRLVCSPFLIRLVCAYSYEQMYKCAIKWRCRTRLACVERLPRLKHTLKCSQTVITTYMCIKLLRHRLTICLECTWRSMLRTCPKIAGVKGRKGERFCTRVLMYPRSRSLPLSLCLSPCNTWQGARSFTHSSQACV